MENKGYKKKYAKTLEVDLPKNYREFIKLKPDIIMVNTKHVKFRDQNEVLSKSHNSYLCLNDL